MIDGIKPSIFKRKRTGWCIRDGSSMSWGGGYPAVYVLDDGSVINAGSSHPKDKKPRKLSQMTHTDGRDGGGDVIEEMGRYLARHNA